MPDSTSPDQLSQINAKLDVMLHHMERMDRRDQLRMVGGFIRSLIMIVPAIIFAWTTWYFFTHSDEILGKITDMATERAINSAQTDNQDFMQQLQEAMQR